MKQTATGQLDAIADRQFSGHIERIGTIASTDFTGGWPFPRNFDLEVALDQTDPRLKPGMTVQLTVWWTSSRCSHDPGPGIVSEVRADRGLRVGRFKFQERVIEVGRRSGDRILVEKGLRAGDRVALKDPTAKE